MVLDVGRIQIERHRLPIEQRVHAREHLVERPVELTDMTEAEAAQKASQRRRLGQPVTAQKLLRRVGQQQRHVVEALTASDQRLAQAQDRLRRRVAAAALLQRHPVEQRHQSRALRPARAPGRARREMSTAASTPPPGPAPTALLPSPSRVPPCRSPGCLATPIVSGREDVPFRATPELPQDPGS